MIILDELRIAHSNFGQTFVNIFSVNNNNFINWAAKYELMAILCFLWEVGCKMNVAVNEYAPLHTACRFGSNRAIEFLLIQCNIQKFSHGVNPSQVGQAGTMAHHFCAHDGNLKMLKLLIEHHDVNPYAVDNMGDNLVHQICSSSNTLLNTETKKLVLLATLQYAFTNFPKLFQMKDSKNRSPLHILMH